MVIKRGRLEGPFGTFSMKAMSDLEGALRDFGFDVSQVEFEALMNLRAEVWGIAPDMAVVFETVSPTLSFAAA